MNSSQRDWIELIENNDFASVWTGIYNLVSRHLGAKSRDVQPRFGGTQTWESPADLTQEVFLKLLEKDRWQHYLAADYDAANVEHELVHVEIPNLVGQALRQRYPESFRLARRISTIVQNDRQFQLYPALRRDPESTSERVPTACRKQVYGLTGWSPLKNRKDEASLVDLISNVACRTRDTRCTGRSSTSQIIISNQELTRLMVEILRAIDAPVEVRTLRTLVLSKLTLSDARITSLTMEQKDGSEATNQAPAIEVVDNRPTPEQQLLRTELTGQIQRQVDDLFDNLKCDVNSKPRRWERLIRVAWHCYFDDRSLSQCQIARELGISNALVTHYRLLFDQRVKQRQLPFDHWLILNDILRVKLSALVAELELPADLPAPVTLARARAQKYASPYLQPCSMEEAADCAPTVRTNTIRMPRSRSEVPVAADAA